jgi:exosortase
MLNLKSFPLPAEKGASTARRWPWLTLAAVGALWLIVINQLRFEWSINPQYSYGWTVPFLGLYLFLKRWSTRPPLGPSRAPLALAVIVALLAFSLMPMRLIQEANPDWRLISWAMALMLAGLTLCALFHAGGWPWVAHFAFPVLFILVAVPWPVPLETRLVQGLMRTNASIAVEGLAWLGFPAAQHGNIIQIGSMQVGVEEACSGVRSLQTTLMISLFLGELYQLGVARRCLLVALGFGVAFLCNVARTFFLVLLSTSRGTDALAKWHNTAGLAVLAGSVAGLLLLAQLLRTKRAAEANAAEPDVAGRRARPLPVRALVALIAWLLLVEAATEVWYRSHESAALKNPAWSIDWPQSGARFKKIEISDTARAILKYNKGEAAAWANPDGSSWMAFFLRLLPGRTAAQLATAHGPGICLPATGIAMRSDLGIRPLQLRGIVLPFHAYVFEYNQRPLHVFYCLWEDRARDGGNPKIGDAITYATRLRAVRGGVRNTGQQVLEIAVLGYDSESQAETALVRQLEEMIRL